MEKAGKTYCALFVSELLPDSHKIVQFVWENSSCQSRTQNRADQQLLSGLKFTLIIAEQRRQQRFDLRAINLSESETSFTPTLTRIGSQDWTGLDCGCQGSVRVSDWSSSVTPSCRGVTSVRHKHDRPSCDPAVTPEPSAGLLLSLSKQDKCCTAQTKTQGTDLNPGNRHRSDPGHRSKPRAQIRPRAQI
ncbi:hypothetical protein WMY93_028865 [Mugilogobius chulae]|uniref:Uncharacterized protein n=1 Tax=Mugilogobius chulae TaxID=88201 RepID=A0AAW0MVT1_9GOBI